MTSTQQILLMGAMLVIQVVAMGLPYWMGRQAGKAMRDALEERIANMQSDIDSGTQRTATNLAESGRQAYGVGGQHD